MGRHLFYLSILYARWRPLYSTSRVLITHGVHRECVECINSGKFDYCSALWCIKNCCTIMWDIRRILLYKRAAMHQSAENINLLAFLCCCLYFYFFLIVHIFGNQCFVFQNIIYMFIQKNEVQFVGARRDSNRAYTERGDTFLQVSTFFHGLLLCDVACRLILLVFNST